MFSTSVKENNIKEFISCQSPAVKATPSKLLLVIESRQIAVVLLSLRGY